MVNLYTPSQIIHVGGTALPFPASGVLTNPVTGKPIRYVHVSADQIFKHQDLFVTAVVRGCKSRNILVFVDSRRSPGAGRVVFNALSSGIPRGLVVDNIAFVNCVATSDDIVPRISQLRKSLNVAFMEQFELVAGAEFLGAVGKYSIKPGVVVTLESALKNYAYLRIIPGREPATPDVASAWWVRTYFAAPPCATVRLTQSTGTCWMNALLNSLLIPIKIATLSRSRIGTAPRPDDIKLRHFPSVLGTVSCKTLTHSLFRALLAPRGKARSSDGNFVGAYAACVKCLYEPPKTAAKQRLCATVDHGTSGHPTKAVPFILESLLQPRDYVIVDIEVDAVKLLPPAKADDILGSFLIRHTPEQMAVSIYSAFARAPALSLVKILANVNGPGGDLPDLLVMVFSRRRHVSALPTTIRVGGSDEHRYTLQSAVIVLRPGAVSSRGRRVMHAIAGYKCLGKYFVYDSHNINAQTNWPAGNAGLGGYLAGSPEVRAHNFSLHEFEVAFYTRSRRDTTATASAPASPPRVIRKLKKTTATTPRRHHIRE